MKTLIHIVHLRLKEKPLPNSMSRRRVIARALLRRSVPPRLIFIVRQEDNNYGVRNTDQDPI
jgi:hypothetical protein